MTNKQIYELTENTSPSADDVVAIDQAADNVSKKVKIQNLPKAFNITDNRLLGRSAGSAGAMQEISVGTGLSLSGGTLTATGSGGADKYPMEARLTLETGVAVSITDQSAKGTLYLTKYAGDQVAVYNGSAWETIALGADISLSLAGLTASRPHDIWVYSNSGTLTLEATAWTNDTTRATALTTQNGIYVKTGDTTRRYIGTIYVDASNQCNSTSSQRHVWNYYNRVNHNLSCVDTTDSWTYTTLTWRSANNNTTDGVGRVSVVIGVAEDTIFAQHYGVAINSNNNIRVAVGIGINSTSSNSAQTYGDALISTAAQSFVGTYNGYLSAGYNFIQRLEISTATGTTTWRGDDGVTTIQTGMHVNMRG